MKKTFLILSFLFTTTLIFSQANKGLNFGVGLSNWGLPVYVNYEFPVHADISLAPQIQFDLSNMDYFVLGIKGDYYFDRVLGIPENFDFYAGLHLGFLSYWGNEVNRNSGIDLNMEIGGRWFWNDKWGLNLEFAGGTGINTKLGLCMKM